MKNLLKYPITTIQGVLFAIVAILTYYNVLSVEAGGLWVGLMLAVFKLFANDNSYNLKSKNDVQTFDDITDPQNPKVPNKPI